jgi:hypothetical protein
MYLCYTVASSLADNPSKKSYQPAVIIIITITGKITPFERYTSLEDFAKLYFATVNYFTEQIR